MGPLSAETEIEELKKLCKHVFVDIKQSDDRKPSPARRKPEQNFLAERDLQVYSNRTILKQEFPRAKSAIQSLSQSVEDIFKSARKGRRWTSRASNVP
ncbi:MAG: hypothetical protein ACI87W_003278 [Halieaceae bacterium]|jgi:hypothetical protein